MVTPREEIERLEYLIRECEDDDMLEVHMARFRVLRWLHENPPTMPEEQMPPTLGERLA